MPNVASKQTYERKKIQQIKNLDIRSSRFIPSHDPIISNVLTVSPHPIANPKPHSFSLSQRNPFAISVYRIKNEEKVYIKSEPEKKRSTHKMKNTSSNSCSPRKAEKQEAYHVIHKLPSGDSPYVRAKYFQLVEKDLEGAIVLFWKAINAGDRVDSALKDMAVVMKQQDRAEQAIEAIKSFRDRCSKDAQESLDNVLIDLYKKCGKLDEQIELLKQKLRMIGQGEAFNGKPTKTARSHGKKFQVTVKQETSRILGNLGWAYMQQTNYTAAEAVYRKAQQIDPDANKACNLCLCLIKQERFVEAKSVLEGVMQGKLPGSDDPKSRSRSEELLKELETFKSATFASPSLSLSLEDAFIGGLDELMNDWNPVRSRRLPIFEEIISHRDQLAC